MFGKKFKFYDFISLLCFNLNLFEEKKKRKWEKMRENERERESLNWARE